MASKKPNTKKPEAKPTPKGRPGRKPYVPRPNDSDAVRMMRAANIHPEMIARWLGCSVMTMRRHFKEEMACAQTEVVCIAMAGMVSQAKAGNVKACAFLLNTVGGILNKKLLVLQNPDGGPIQMSAKITTGPKDVKEMTDEELKAICNAYEAEQREREDAENPE